MSERNSSASFTITTPAAWTAYCDADWLILSSKSGNGNTTVTITANSQNDSASDRIATITISGSSNTEVISVTQLPAFKAGCSVGIEDMLALNTSVAFKYVVESNVSYFYAGFLEKSAAGWTDDKIVATLEANFSEKSPDLVYGGFGSLDSNTEYFICAVGYDSKGNRGELSKTLVKTLPSRNSDPWVYINNVSYSSTYWFWNSEPDSYVNKYYMSVTQGSTADLMSYLYPAQVAYLMREGINSGEMQSIARGGSWQIGRTNSSMSLFVATWATDSDNKFSAQLNSGLWTINSSSAPAKQSVQNKEMFLNSTQVQAIKAESRILPLN